MRAILLFVGLMLAWALIFSLPTMLLWNWLMPHLFGAPVIDLWQALGLALLARFLLGTGSSKNNS